MAEPVQRGALAIAQVPVAGPQPPQGRAGRGWVGVDADPGSGQVVSEGGQRGVQPFQVSCSGELCGVRVIPAVDVAVVQVKSCTVAGRLLAWCSLLTLLGRGWSSSLLTLAARS
jgi:hypothetical protein